MKLFIYLLLALSLSTTGLAKDFDWLVGDWTVSDHTGKTENLDEMLRFGADRQFSAVLLASSGRNKGLSHLKGMFFVKPSSVQLNVIHFGRIVAKLEVGFNKEKDQLVFKNPDRGDVTTYAKVQPEK